MEIVEVGVEFTIAGFAQAESLPSTYSEGVVIGDVPCEVGISPPEAVAVSTIGAKRVYATEHVEAVIAGAESGVIPGGFFLFDHDGLFEGFAGSREERRGGKGHQARESNNRFIQFHFCLVVCCLFLFAGVALWLSRDKLPDTAVSASQALSVPCRISLKLQVNSFFENFFERK